jgi:mannose-6-phosphate isomerase
VPSGTIHAIGEGIIILETQQNSDTTYRVYDYDRRDKEGNPRELHIQQSIEVTTVPSADPELQSTIKKLYGAEITTFVECDYFTVHKWELNGQAQLEQDQKFLLISVIEGEGALEHGGHSHPFRKGDHFLLPSEFGQYQLNGQANLIVSHL